jgi:hypothetical protein
MTLRSKRKSSPFWIILCFSKNLSSIDPRQDWVTDRKETSWRSRSSRIFAIDERPCRPVDLNYRSSGTTLTCLGGARRWKAVFFKSVLSRDVASGVKRTRHQLAPAVPRQKIIDRALAGFVPDGLFIGRLAIVDVQHFASPGGLGKARQQTLR